MQIECEVKTLSYIIESQKLQRIDLLKIDCEGNELKVLEGINDSHWKVIKQLIIEVHDIDNRLNTIIKILKNQNYDVEIEKEDSMKNTRLFNVIATS